MNLLAIYPYIRSPISEIAVQVGEALERFYDGKKNIEIEFKYAEIKQFFNTYVVNHLKTIKMEQNNVFTICKIAESHALQQNNYHLQTLYTLSQYGLVLLNSLDKKYQLKGDFYEKRHKKFYKMREFLEKLCIQNQTNSIGNGLNFYADLQREIENNRTFKIVNHSQIRLDININNGEYAGRYSYEVGKGWTKTNKTSLLREQFDLMMNKRTFRLAMKEEKEIQVDTQIVKEALNQRISFMRFKRSLKVQKGDYTIITLSEIFQPSETRREELLEDLRFLLTMETFQLDEFAEERFQQFYMSNTNENELNDIRASKFEIESEFTQKAVGRMADLWKKRAYRDVERLLESGLQDLYALYFVDHNTKQRETRIMRQMKHGQQDFPDCRLDNQFGSYMHDLVYDYMKN